MQQLSTVQLPKEAANLVLNGAKDQEHAQQPLTVGGLAQAMRAVVDTHAGEAASLTMVKATKAGDGKTLLSEVMQDTGTTQSPLLQEQQSAQNFNHDNTDQRNPASLTALHELLSDVDASGLGVRYGTLPALINGELVELELVLFKQRQTETGVEPIKRLVMSIHTQSMGTVWVSAESLNQRLLVNISAQTVEHAEALGSYAHDVKALAERLGWAVESVAYEVKPLGTSLAKKVMEHSIRQGVIDHVW